MGVGVGDRQMPDLAPGGKEGGRERDIARTQRRTLASVLALLWLLGPSALG